MEKTHVYCANQKEWDFVAKTLGRTVDVGYKEVGDSIFISDANCSNFKKNLYSDHMYSFQEWCDKFGHINPFNKSLTSSKELTSLPEKWCVKRTKEHGKIINDWFTNNGYGDAYLCANDYIFIVDSTTYSSNFYVPKGFTEITFEQFKKWVLKEETKENKSSKYEVNKWYQDTLNETPLYIKYQSLSRAKSNIYSSERILNGKFEIVLNDSWTMDTNVRNWQLITDLSIIQEYLPEGHVDKWVKTETMEETAKRIFFEKGFDKIKKGDKYVSIDGVEYIASRDAGILPSFNIDCGVGYLWNNNRPNKFGYKVEEEPESTEPPKTVQTSSVKVPKIGELVYIIEGKSNDSIDFANTIQIVTDVRSTNNNSNIDFFTIKGGNSGIWCKDEWRYPTTEELIKEVEKRYPIGTKFISPENKKEYTLKKVNRANDSRWLTKKKLIVNTSEYSGIGQYIFYDGQWAEKVYELEEPKLPVEGAITQIVQGIDPYIRNWNTQNTYSNFIPDVVTSYETLSLKEVMEKYGNMYFGTPTTQQSKSNTQLKMLPVRKLKVRNNNQNN